MICPSFVAQLAVHACQIHHIPTQTQTRRPATPVSTPKRRAPRTFIRIHTADDSTNLQTTVTTYKSDSKVLNIHSLLHIADARYFLSLQNLKDTVLFELITSSKNVYSEGKLRRLKTDVRATPRSRKIGRRLQAVAQADALELCLPNWYLADVPSEQLPIAKKDLQLPNKLWLRIVACLLPCPELNLLTLDNWAMSPKNIVQLLKASFPEKRRLTYAWRLLRGTPPPAEVARDNSAWDTVRRVDGTTHLLYGAWHSERFCRRAENDGMEFVKQDWVDVMRLPRVEIGVRDCVVWGGIVLLAAGVAGVDWIGAVDGAFVRDGRGVVAYLIRHLAIYWAIRRWFEEW